jgi:hypothetical protein
MQQARCSSRQHGGRRGRRAGRQRTRHQQQLGAVLVLHQARGVARVRRVVVLRAGDGAGRRQLQRQQVGPAAAARGARVCGGAGRCRRKAGRRAAFIHPVPPHDPAADPAPSQRAPGSGRQGQQLQRLPLASDRAARRPEAQLACGTAACCGWPGCGGWACRWPPRWRRARAPAWRAWRRRRCGGQAPAREPAFAAGGSSSAPPHLVAVVEPHARAVVVAHAAELVHAPACGRPGKPGRAGRASTRHSARLGLWRGRAFAPLPGPHHTSQHHSPYLPVMAAASASHSARGSRSAAAGKRSASVAPPQAGPPGRSTRSTRCRPAGGRGSVHVSPGASSAPCHLPRQPAGPA